MPHLPPAHHETSKHDSPNKTNKRKIKRNYPGFKFKPRQVNDLSQSNQGTDHLVSQIKLLKSRILGLEAVERSRARQKSILTWMKLGDVNTKFFHMVANGWKKGILSTPCNPMMVWPCLKMTSTL
jgi:hypothetical protein